MTGDENSGFISLFGCGGDTLVSGSFCVELREAMLLLVPFETMSSDPSDLVSAWMT